MKEVVLLCHGNGRWNARWKSKMDSSQSPLSPIAYRSRLSCASCSVQRRAARSRDRLESAQPHAPWTAEAGGWSCAPPSGIADSYGRFLALFGFKTIAHSTSDLLNPACFGQPVRKTHRPSAQPPVLVSASASQRSTQRRVQAFANELLLTNCKLVMNFFPCRCPPILMALDF
jgi:hypothetical protein